MRKRAIPLLLAVMLLLGIVSGCADGDTAESPTQQATQSPTSAAVTQGVVETDTPEEVEGFKLPIVDEYLEFTYWYSAPPWIHDYVDDMADQQVYKELADRTGIHIDFQTISILAAEENFNVMVATGDYTDLIDSCGRLYTKGADSAVESGFVVNIADYMDEYMPNYKAFLYSDDYFTKAVFSDSGVMAWVNMFSVSAGGAMGMTTRGDWLEAVSMNAPVTYDEYYDVLKAYQTELGKDGAFWLPYMGVYYYNVFSAGYGIAACTHADLDQFTNQNGTVVYGPIEDSFKDYLTRMNQWYDEGLIYKDFMAEASEFKFTPAALVNNNEVGFFMSQLGYYSGYYSSDDPNFALLGLSHARINKSDDIHIGFADTKVNASGSIGVSTKCKYPEIAAQWIDYWFTDDGFLLYNYGIEDVSYTIDENGDPQFTDLITNNEQGLSLTFCLNIYTILNRFGMSDGKRSLVVYNDYQLEVLELWQEGDRDYNYPEVASMTESESELYYQNFRDINTYVSENVVKFITGQNSMDGWDAYVAQVKELGIDECIALKQAALDRFNSRG